MYITISGSIAHYDFFGNYISLILSLSYTLDWVSDHRQAGKIKAYIHDKDCDTSKHFAFINQKNITF